MFEVDQRNVLKYTLLIRKVSALGVLSQRRYVIYEGRWCWRSGYKSNSHRQVSPLRNAYPNQIVSRIFLSRMLMGDNGLLNFNARHLILMNGTYDIQPILKRAFKIPGLSAAIDVRNKKLSSKQ